jgi:hypothetical protein
MKYLRTKLSGLSHSRNNLDDYPIKFQRGKRSHAVGYMLCPYKDIATDQRRTNFARNFNQPRRDVGLLFGTGDLPTDQ